MIDWIISTIVFIFSLFGIILFQQYPLIKFISIVYCFFYISALSYIISSIIKND